MYVYLYLWLFEIDRYWDMLACQLNDGTDLG